MEHYYIFKTDRTTGKTVHICNGSHETREECRRHWQYYMYGFMDAMNEIGCLIRESDTPGQTVHSFIADYINAEYFMLMGDEGRNLIFEIANK